jgi:hypothetical protein
MKTSRATSQAEQSYAHFYPVIAPLIMCAGIGDGKTTACLVAQCATIDALRKGQTLDAPTDEMECACPVLRRLAIRFNDAAWWKSDAERTEHLRPLIPLLLDSRGSPELTQRRVFFVADNCVRVLTPLRLEYIAKHSKSDRVKKENAAGCKALRALAPIVDRETALAAREGCKKLRADASAYASASASASASADADASADASADAYASADASAYAYASASASASASAYASAQKLKYRTLALQLFRDTAALK